MLPKEEPAEGEEEEEEEPPAEEEKKVFLTWLYPRCCGFLFHLWQCKLRRMKLLRKTKILLRAIKKIPARSVWLHGTFFYSNGGLRMD